MHVIALPWAINPYPPPINSPNATPSHHLHPAINIYIYTTPRRSTKLNCLVWLNFIAPSLARNPTLSLLLKKSPTHVRKGFRLDR